MNKRTIRESSHNPEDSRKDKFILKPLFESLFRSMDRPKIRIQVCEDPVLGSVAEVLKSRRIADVVLRHREMIHMFILCVDRDGKVGRRQRLDQIESEFGGSRIFLAENAWEELETWVLAGLDLPENWDWQTVRAEVHVKEKYFEPLTLRLGMSDAAGAGRKTLGEQAARRIGAIRQKCPDDFDSLAERLEAALRGSVYEQPAE